MQKIVLQTKEKENAKSDQPFLLLLFLLAGIYGMLLLFQEIDGIVYPRYIHALPTVICTVLWYSRKYSRKLFLLLTVGISIVSCAACFAMRDILQEEALQIWNCIFGKTDLEVISVTETVLLLTVFLSMGFFVLEIILKSHILLYVLTTASLLLFPLVGIRPGIVTVGLLIFFQIVFQAAILSKQKAVSRLSGGKYVGIIAVMVAGCLVAAFFLVSYYEQELYGFVYEAEGYVYRQVSKWSGHADQLATDGKIHTGNHYNTKAALLELTVSAKPTEDLYLRGFEGDAYIGGNWTRCDEDVLFVMIAEKLYWQGWVDTISSLYHNLFFEMNRHVQRDVSPMPITLEIRHVNGDYTDVYEPYYSQRQRSQKSIEYREQADGYEYLYYEQSDMNIEWENILPEYEWTKEWNLVIRDAYMDEIQTVYTKVPTELLPHLSRFVEEHPLDGLDEITAFILYTLHSNASYSLTPGWTPFQEDIAEYFLFQNRRGYCEHFALTATLLYRLYGTPARYISGYRVSSDDFVQQTDGTYRAVVTDESAHAWTEIFLEDYGWTPIEVTPAEDGSTNASYPGFENRDLNHILSLKHWDMDVPSLPNLSDASKNEGKITQDASDRWEIAHKKYKHILWAFGACMLYSLFLLPFFADYRRLKFLKKVEIMHCRKVYYRLLKMIHFSGYLIEYDGSEREFASRFAEEIHEVSEKEIGRVQSIVEEAAYGKGNVTMEEEAFVRSVYFRTGKVLYGRLTWKRKMLFRYWKMFG